MSHESTLVVTSTVQRTPESLSGSIDARAVLMSVESGKYYNMNAMGTRIWDRIESPQRIDVLIQGLLEEFSVEPAVCESEVLKFLTHLQREHLVEVRA